MHTEARKIGIDPEQRSDSNGG